MKGYDEYPIALVSKQELNDALDARSTRGYQRFYGRILLVDDDFVYQDLDNREGPGSIVKHARPAAYFKDIGVADHLVYEYFDGIFTEVNVECAVVERDIDRKYAIERLKRQGVNESTVELLQFGHSVNKRLDEHRELVEAIELSTTLFVDKPWYAMHMATQDDYLMRLFHMVHKIWPDDPRKGLIPGMPVRERPEILGLCLLPDRTDLR
ncbi:MULTISPECIES: hypothetical protein [Pseudomonas syringae group]|uniref:Uncharacterized protein n=1 Tax=Pseudomonas meliae TaxID=86176 RepID=A0A0P9UQ12_9PSED|nr:MULTISPECIES: hypothetical protein [Pseudomonas syringae group]KPX80282.1 Uncharacterized protein ALO64_02663 [Pseudomonas meliae]RXU06378.1 hypothetical protein B1F68_12685 [Pseudomonas syringae]